mmetsp:Transcript_76195/g.182275  ORF Transcript_76195/g.182275 Transcript_76195/m.182275 type:complete len:212 (+) Transcript_76195:131-766(+)
MPADAFATGCAAQGAAPCEALSSWLPELVQVPWIDARGFRSGSVSFFGTLAKPALAEMSLCSPISGSGCSESATLMQRLMGCVGGCSAALPAAGARCSSSVTWVLAAPAPTLPMAPAVPIAPMVLAAEVWAPAPAPAALAFGPGTSTPSKSWPTRRESSSPSLSCGEFGAKLSPGSASGWFESDSLTIDGSATVASRCVAPALGSAGAAAS